MDSNQAKPLPKIISTRYQLGTLQYKLKWPSSEGNKYSYILPSDINIVNSGTDNNYPIEQSTTICSLCNDSNNSLLCCDSCSRAYHIYCLPYNIDVDNNSNILHWNCHNCTSTNNDLYSEDVILQYLYNNDDCCKYDLGSDNIISEYNIDSIEGIKNFYNNYIDNNNTDSEETWILCQDCYKWRKINNNILNNEIEDIYNIEHWSCSMNYWNIEENSCDITESKEIFYNKQNIDNISIRLGSEQSRNKAIKENNAFVNELHQFYINQQEINSKLLARSHIKKLLYKPPDINLPIIVTFSVLESTIDSVSLSNKPMDFNYLFSVVQSFGGYNNVSKSQNAWRDIYRTTTNYDKKNEFEDENKLQLIYLLYLYDYEVMIKNL